MSTPAPDLRTFDLIVVNTSAGKDSQAMLDVIARQAEAAGVLDRVVAVHCDLGRVEWKGTRELAEEQAAAYGIRFEVVRRELGDLLDQIEARGMFPSSTARYCTSDQKTAQVLKLMTRLVGELALDRPVRILNCLGIRAEESAARAKKAAYGADKAASNGKREVTRWLPIFDWTEAQVWERIAQAGTPSHRAYSLGMSRLSCCFCVLAARADLIIAAQANPELAADYAAVEARIGHRFTEKLSMAELIAEAGVGATLADEAAGALELEQLALFA